VVDAGVVQVAYASPRHSTLFWRLEITSKCDAHKLQLTSLGRLMSFGEIVSGACSISNKSNTRVKYTHIFHGRVKVRCGVDFFCTRTPRPFSISRVVLTLEQKSLNGSQCLIVLQPFLFLSLEKCWVCVSFQHSRKKRRRACQQIILILAIRKHSWSVGW
jgi:hypothetical protein